MLQYIKEIQHYAKYIILKQEHKKYIYIIFW